MSIRVDESVVQGTVAPGFEKVRDEFVGNFTQRQELGAACALGHSRGSFAYADPDSGAGFAYAMNRSGFYVFGDPRETALSDAFFACIPKI